MIVQLPGRYMHVPDRHSTGNDDDDSDSSPERPTHTSPIIHLRPYAQGANVPVQGRACPNALGEGGPCSLNRDRSFTQSRFQSRFQPDCPAAFNFRSCPSHETCEKHGSPRRR